MRRLLAAALLALTATIGLTACGGDDNPSADATPTTTTGSGDVAANTAQVCADADAAIDASAQQFATAVQGLTAATAGDQAAKDAAVASIKQVFVTWATAVRQQSDKALDPEFKAALTTMADEFDKAGAQIKSFDDLAKIDQIADSPAINAAGEKVEQFCPSIGK